jgi:hypothetical protein
MTSDLTRVAETVRRDMDRFLVLSNAGPLENDIRAALHVYTGLVGALTVDAADATPQDWQEVARSSVYDVAGVLAERSRSALRILGVPAPVTPLDDAFDLFLDVDFHSYLAGTVSLLHRAAISPGSVSLGARPGPLAAGISRALFAFVTLKEEIDKALASV